MSIIIPIEEIKEGMISAEPIINNYGQTLLPAGAELKEKHKFLMKTWNIGSITIESDETEEDQELTEDERAQLMEKLSIRFRWKPRNPQEEDLLNMTIIHLARQVVN